MIPDGVKTNFQTMKNAMLSDRLALMECQDKTTGKTAYVVCMVNILKGEIKQFEFVPVAKMFDGNPYQELNPPDPKGGFRTEEV